MKSIERIVWIVIVSALIIFTFIRKPGILTVIEKVPGDSIFTEVTINKDSLIYKYDTIIETEWVHDTAFLPTDTNAILADYFKVRDYDSIPIQNDTSMTIYASAKVTQNTLFEFKGYAKNNRNTTIINNYQQESYIGIGAIIGQGILAPTASFQWKRHEIGVGYEIYNKGFLFKYEHKFPIKKIKLWRRLTK